MPGDEPGERRPAKPMRLGVEQGIEPLEMPSIPARKRGVAELRQERRRDGEGEAGRQALRCVARQQIEQRQVRVGERLQEPPPLDRVVVLARIHPGEVRVEHESDGGPSHAATAARVRWTAARRAAGRATRGDGPARRGGRAPSARSPKPT